MTIRTRLTVWYAGILLVALLIVVGWSYYELSVEHRGGKGAEEWAAGESDLSEVGEIALYGGVPAILLALVGGWFLMRRTLAPLTQLTQTIESIHAGNLHQRLPRTGSGDELDRLTQVFNEMVGRLDDHFQRIREFSLHASHELKTPLTIMHASLETALKEEELGVAQHERVAMQLGEVKRLTKIVDGLTLLMKADSGLMSLKEESLRLDELVRETFEDVQILAQQQKIEAILTACELVRVDGDRNRLRQLLLNLSDNAIKYNHEGGRVTMALRQKGQKAELVITNTGPGLPRELHRRVFDRFFRGDPAHNNEVDGCGLGLSIAQRIAQLHRGSIDFCSEPGKETIVRFEMPCHSVSGQPAMG